MIKAFSIQAKRSRKSLPDQTKRKYNLKYRYLLNHCLSFTRVDNPVRAEKVANTRLTTLQIHEERYFGSLTCHVVRDVNNTLYDHFFANSSTVFRFAMIE